MQLNYKIIGDGQPVILLHGLFGTLDNLGRLARHLSTTYQVISIDLPNHGLSPHTNSISYPDMANSVSDLCDELGLNKVNIVGHSMGGKVAMELALLKPQLINTLTVIDIAPVAYTDRHNHIFNALKTVNLEQINNRTDASKHLVAQGIEPGIAQFLLKNLAKDTNSTHFWRCNLDGLHKNYSSIITGLTTTGTYDKPTLFVKGGNSNYILAEHRPTIMGYFPQAQAKIVQGTGHWLHAEKPASVNKIVDDFLSNHQN
ncbi:alpha/beta fold hydrolase [Psychrobium sp. 1_MG-2023]|uniref:alpha/beta fold hydrolase n=1 Tax=Psychrobium sp. 1_MG-2023 TaxID=3062624 RepID=UPI000C335669|nr:alpha/beta fold hydrolase [Psychrobium sp. 1_MG-2023]MDP2562483.1 alpha/beta fold hydrolase [Psychrobium sp. 1_MG-2023]PKF54317.1 alpha/beta hydrolase [Alteromonadales bacterium alter-6D02]